MNSIQSLVEKKITPSNFIELFKILSLNIAEHFPAETAFNCSTLPFKTKDKPKLNFLEIKNEEIFIRFKYLLDVLTYYLLSDRTKEQYNLSVVFYGDFFATVINFIDFYVYLFQQAEALKIEQIKPELIWKQLKLWDLLEFLYPKLEQEFSGRSPMLFPEFAALISKNEKAIQEIKSKWEKVSHLMVTPPTARLNLKNNYDTNCNLVISKKNTTYMKIIQYSELDELIKRWLLQYQQQIGNLQFIQCIYLNPDAHLDPILAMSEIENEYYEERLNDNTLYFVKLFINFLIVLNYLKKNATQIIENDHSELWHSFDDIMKIANAIMEDSTNNASQIKEEDIIKIVHSFLELLRLSLNYIGAYSTQFYLEFKHKTDQKNVEKAFMERFFKGTLFWNTLFSYETAIKAKLPILSIPESQTTLDFSLMREKSINAIFAYSFRSNKLGLEPLLHTMEMFKKKASERKFDYSKTNTDYNSLNETIVYCETVKMLLPGLRRKDSDKLSMKLNELIYSIYFEALQGYLIYIKFHPESKYIPDAKEKTKTLMNNLIKAYQITSLNFREKNLTPINTLIEQYNRCNKSKIKIISTRHIEDEYYPHVIKIEILMQLRKHQEAKNELLIILKQVSGQTKAYCQLLMTKNCLLLFNDITSKKNLLLLDESVKFFNKFLCFLNTQKNHNFCFQYITDIIEISEKIYHLYMNKINTIPLAAGRIKLIEKLKAIMTNTTSFLSLIEKNFFVESSQYERFKQYQNELSELSIKTQKMITEDVEKLQQEEQLADNMMHTFVKEIEKQNKQHIEALNRIVYFRRNKQISKKIGNYINSDNHTSHQENDEKTSQMSLLQTQFDQELEEIIKLINQEPVRAANLLHDKIDGLNKDKTDTLEKLRYAYYLECLMGIYIKIIVNKTPKDITSLYQSLSSILLDMEKMSALEECLQEAMEELRLIQLNEEQNLLFQTIEQGVQLDSEFIDTFLEENKKKIVEKLEKIKELVTGLRHSRNLKIYNMGKDKLRAESRDITIDDYDTIFKEGLVLWRSKHQEPDFRLSMDFHSNNQGNF